jgi:hypothetical protein
VVTNTVNSFERSVIKNTWMPSPTHQDIMINLTVCLPICRQPSVFINAVMWENWLLDVTKSITTNSITITISMATLSCSCWFEKTRSPHFCIDSSLNIRVIQYIL